KSLRKDHESRQQEKVLLTIEDARKNAVGIDWSTFTPHSPSFIGKKSLLNFPLEQIRPYIDWTPFFQTWMLYGRYPGILTDPKVGTEASKLYAEAQALLDQIIAGRKLKANAVIAFYPAQRISPEDIQLYADKAGQVPLQMMHFLRQQNKKAANLPNYSLADFVAPVSSGKLDYLGLFAVTAGIGLDKLIEGFKAQQDDYHEIMAKALADRLAEAFAECLHHQVRKDWWGYAAGERITNEQMIAEEYQGIRPAPGYPACPDHTEKKVIFDLLQADKEAGIQLTESMAMYPASSVSGYYFSHPESRYFGLGKIDRDQVKEYASRKGMPVEEIERWLAPVLGY
ncbi:MAG: methionine synthase, partial [Bacteroidetes bacterium]|nr:methionine synthase [Bacteroidota bacterium]